MKEEILAELGLSKNESKIYLSLLEQGSSTITKIAQISSVHRVNVYDSLSRLREKGLIGEMSQNGKKEYQAAAPEALKNILREKERKLNQVMPQLELFRRLTEKKYQVEVYEGISFLRNLFLHFLEIKEDILISDVPVFALQHIGAEFQNSFHERRIKQKQKMYHIYSKEAMERIKHLNTLAFTQARHLDQEYSHNASTLVCGKEVAIHIFHEKNEKKNLTIVMNNPQIAETYKNHFFILWERAKKP